MLFILFIVCIFRFLNTFGAKCSFSGVKKYFTFP